MQADNALINSATMTADCLSVRHAEWLICALHSAAQDATYKRTKARAIRKLLTSLPNAWQTQVLPVLRDCANDMISSSD